MPIVLWFIPIDQHETNWTFCLFKNITGKNCYGCGITRATLSVIHFDLTQAIAFNKLIVGNKNLLINNGTKYVTT